MPITKNLCDLLEIYNPRQHDVPALGKNNQEHIHASSSAQTTSSSHEDTLFNAIQMRLEVSDALEKGLIPYPETISESSYQLEIIGGLNCHALKNSNATNTPTLVMFFGGGFCLNTIVAHKSFMAHIASQVSCNIIIPEVPLAPEHKATEILTFLDAFMYELTGNALPLGFSNDITLLGWSSGGNLALTTALNLRNKCAEHFAKITHIIAMSSWIDLSMKSICEGPYKAQQALDSTAAGATVLSQMGRCYLSEREHGFEPSICPAARDEDELCELPLVTLIAGEHDVILADSILMANSLNQAGAKARLILLEGQTHNYLVFDKLSKDGVFVPALISKLIKEEPVEDMVASDGLGLKVTNFNFECGHTYRAGPS